MKKRNLVLSVFSLLAIGTIAVGASSGAFRGLGEMLLADGTTTVWRHYPRREATPTEKGIREYWVSCSSHEVTFEKPTSGTIEDMTEYDTSEFTEHDERWIYTASLPAQEVLMTAATKSLDLGGYAGGVITSIKSGEYSFGTDASALDVSPLADKATHGVRTVEIETTKDNKLFVLSCETTFVTAEISNSDEFASYIWPQKDVTAKFGYYKLKSQIDLRNPIDTLRTNWYAGAKNSTFSGTLDGAGFKILAKSNVEVGVFGRLNNAKIKNLLVEDLYYTGTMNGSILGCIIKDTTFENLTVKITYGKPEMAKDGVGEPACHAPISGEGSCGYIANNTFQSNTLKNCTFDCSGYKMGSLFGWHQNMTKPTVTNSVIKAASLVQAMHSNYKNMTYQPEGHAGEGEEEIKGLTLEIA